MRIKKIYFCLILVSPVVHAQAFKCTDATGRTTFSQTPCQADGSTSVEVKLQQSSAPTQSSQVKPHTIFQKTEMSDDGAAAQGEIPHNKTNVGDQFPSNGCEVISFVMANKTNKFAAPTYPGSDYLRISEITESCANVKVGCGGGGSRLVDSEKLVAHFADGKTAKPSRNQQDSVRVNSGESVSIHACFGSNGSQITKIIFK